MDLEKYTPKVVDTSNHENRINSICYSPDQTLLCSCGGDRNVYLKYLQDSERTEKLLHGHTEAVFGTDFSYKSELLATGSCDRTIRIWKITTSDESGSVVLKDGTSGFDDVNCVLFYRNDQTKLISGGYDRIIKIWNISKMKSVTTLKSEGYILSLDILPDDRTLVSADYQVKFWDIRTGKMIKKLSQNEDYVSAVHVHSDSHSVASGSSDNRININDFRTYKRLKGTKLKKEVYSVCFHPSGKYLLSGLQDNTVRIFPLFDTDNIFDQNSTSGNIFNEELESIFTLKEHSKPVWATKFSPDGRHFATGGSDQQLKIWNFPLGGIFGNEKQSKMDEYERVGYLFSESYLEMMTLEQDKKVLEVRINRGDCSTINFYIHFFM